MKGGKVTWLLTEKDRLDRLIYKKTGKPSDYLTKLHKKETERKIRKTLKV